MLSGRNPQTQHHFANLCWHCGEQFVRLFVQVGNSLFTVSYSLHYVQHIIHCKLCSVECVKYELNIMCDEYELRTDRI